MDCQYSVSSFRVLFPSVQTSKPMNCSYHANAYNYSKDFYDNDVTVSFCTL